MKFLGKRLLMLGSNVGSVEMVRYAQANGAFVLAADFLPIERSASKQAANEDLLVSTADGDTLEEIIGAKHIDGVIAGVSEFNLLQAMSLSERCGLRFYCDRAQWDQIERKDQFRALCVQYQVPCPKTYYVGAHPEKCKNVCFPIVVKPVDSSSSVGVSICLDASNYQCALQEACQKSQCGKVILEEFFEGDEFSAHYVITNSEIELVCVDNRYPVTLGNHTATSVPIARVYPSTFMDEYIAQVNNCMVNLIESLHLSVGVLFVQGLYNKKTNQFRIFEAGLRSAGEAPSRFLEKIFGLNYNHAILDYILLGQTTTGKAGLYNPRLNGKVCAVISLVSRGGRIKQIMGVHDVVNAVPDIIDYEQRYREGDTIPQGNTLRQIIIRFVLICETRDLLAENIQIINNGVKVFDEKGEDMCIRFTPERLFEIE